MTVKKRQNSFDDTRPLWYNPRRKVSYMLNPQVKNQLSEVLAANFRKPSRTLQSVLAAIARYDRRQCFAPTRNKLKIILGRSR